ncbi:MAG TPA: ABC transporter permease, partial [Gemmatimonadales bacterium]
MKAGRLVTIATRSILKNKMRALLTMLGIIIGVAAVIVMVAIGQGAKSQIQQRVNSLGTNLVVITPGATAAGGVSQGAQTATTRLTAADAEALQRESTLLTGVSPVVVTMVQLVGGTGNWRSQVNGVSADYGTIRDWPVTSGQFFDATDVKAMRKVALLGKTVADQLFAGTDPVGQQIRLRNEPFDVIGVLAAKGQTAEGRDQDDIVLAPYTTVQTRLAGRSFITQIIGSTANPDDIQAAQDEVHGIMREAHRLVEGEPDDFTVRNQSDL